MAIDLDIESYMDESGIHQHAKICTVAGYYGTYSAWRGFETGWRKVLRSHGLEDHGFHAKEFWGRSPSGKRVPPYDGWEDDKASKFLNSLLQVVMRSRIFPFGHGIVVQHFKQLSLLARRVLTGGVLRNGKFVISGSPNKPYYVPFVFCLIDSARNSGATDKVHFFAGLDKSFSGYANVLYKRILNDLTVPIRHLFGTIAFPLSKDAPGIQAADMFTYLLYQHNVARFRGHAEKPPILKALIRHRRPHQEFVIFNRKRLLDLLTDYTERS